MKKHIFVPILIILILLSTTGCNSKQVETTNSHISSTEIVSSSSKIEELDNSTTVSSEDENSSNNVVSIFSVPIPKKEDESSSKIFPKLEDIELLNWQKAYMEFLLSYVEISEHSPTSFFLNDFDNDGIPELIINIRDIPDIYEANMEFYSYDTYNNNVYYIGEHHDPKTGVALPRVSQNTEFKGLFTNWWGGSKFAHGYISIENDTLKYEELWMLDDSTNEKIEKVFSGNTELVNESKCLFPRSSERDDNTLIKQYFIDDNGFAEAFAS